ncbi:MAG: hypothetical protein P8174_00480 [Gemmatimonadota bacterium]
MFDAIVQALPPGWRAAASLIVSIVAWVPAWQSRVLSFVFSPGGSLATLASWLLLVLPAMLLVVAMWTTMLSVYTLPFRSGRTTYVRSVAFTWWDAGRGVSLYWAGLARLALVLVGLVWGGLRFVVVLIGKLIKSLFATPAAALDWTARRYFKPGVPWLAFVLILGWSALEGAVFTFTLRPTISEVLYDLTGAPPNPALLTPILFMLLFMLIAGSFACIQVLTEAIHKRNVKEIIQMLVVEFFVMFFEVVFLYRELIDAITPWIAQQTADQIQLGLVSTLALGAFGWVGIRGMTWFLFGRFGTPAVIAILSRETLRLDEAAVQEQANVEPMRWWRDMLLDFKRERDWFRAKADELAELMVLPILQLMAVALNFCLIVVTSRPAFDLPFASLKEALARIPRRNVQASEPVETVRSVVARPAPEV